MNNQVAENANVESLYSIFADLALQEGERVTLIGFGNGDLIKSKDDHKGEIFRVGYSIFFRHKSS